MLRATWPAGLDPLDKPVREQWRREHGVWADDPAAGQQVWIEFPLFLSRRTVDTHVASLPSTTLV